MFFPQRMACYWIAIKGNKMQMCKKRTRNIISGSYFGLFPPVAERSCQHDCFLSDLLSLCLKRKFCDTCKKMCLIRKMYSIPAAKSLDGKLKLSTLAEDAHPPHSWREASQPLPPARDIHSLSGWWRLYSLWGGSSSSGSPEDEFPPCLPFPVVVWQPPQTCTG